jgi:hypothetical protein
VNFVAEALMTAPVVASSTAVLLGASHAMLRPKTLLAAAEKTGTTQDAKKLEGVVVPPEMIAEVTRKNVTVRVALAVPEMRSEGEMVKITVEIVEPIVHVPDKLTKT